MKRAAALLLAAALWGCAGPRQPEDDSDYAVKARVETALRGHDDISLKYLVVDVNQGVVTVSGLIANHQQRNRVGRIVRRVRGVQQLLNNLAVQD